MTEIQYRPVVGGPHQRFSRKTRRATSQAPTATHYLDEIGEVADGSAVVTAAENENATFLVAEDEVRETAWCSHLHAA